MISVRPILNLLSTKELEGGETDCVGGGLATWTGTVDVVEGVLDVPGGEGEKLCFARLDDVFDSDFAAVQLSPHAVKVDYAKCNCGNSQCV